MLNTCENSLHFMSTLGLRIFRKLSLHICPIYVLVYMSYISPCSWTSNRCWGHLGDDSASLALGFPSGVTPSRVSGQAARTSCVEIWEEGVRGLWLGTQIFHSPPHHRWPVGSLAGIFICLWMCEGQREVVQLLRLTNKMFWRDLIFRPTSALWNTPNEVGRAEALTVLRVSFSASVLWLLDLFAF